MKKILLLFLVLSKLSSFAQLNKNVTPDDLKALKRSTTVFIISDVSEDSVEKLQAFFDTIWTFNEMICVPLSEKDEYTKKDGNYSFISVSEWHGLGIIGVDLVYTMFTSIDKEVLFYEIPLVMKPREAKKILKYIWKRKNRNKNYDDLFYNQPIYLDWKWGYMKNNLQRLEQTLKDAYPIAGTFDTTKYNDAGVQSLQKDTLYVSSDILFKYRYLSRKIKRKAKPKRLFKRYKYPYKILSDEELNNKILNDTGHFYYLKFFIDYNDRKCFQIINGKTGVMVFKNNYVTGWRNIKKKHIKYVYKEIRETIEENERAAKAANIGG